MKRSAPDWGPAFLEALAGTANIRAACRAAKVGRSTVYDRRDSEVEFARAMAAALEDAVDDLELEARRRAHDGCNKPVVYKGELMGFWVDAKGDRLPLGADPAEHEGARFVPLTIKEYSDTLMVLLLKAHRPEKYREHHKVEHTGKVGVAVSAEDLSDDELAAIVSAARKRKPE